MSVAPKLTGQATEPPATEPDPPVALFDEVVRSTSLTLWSLRRRTIVVATPGWLGAQPVMMIVGAVPPPDVAVVVGAGVVVEAAAAPPALEAAREVRYVLCGRTSATSRIRRS